MPVSIPPHTASDLRLHDGSRVGVVGGGPAGSFFAYFLLENAQRLGLELGVDIYEPRDFTRPGPAGCNMCGGIISESLVQHLATEGINLPPSVVQRGIDAYALHLDVGSVRIVTPLQEKRIAAIHRGAGPRGATSVNKCGLDQFLLQLAVSRGAIHRRARVEGLEWSDGRPRVTTAQGTQDYDLLASAIGVNSPASKLFEKVALGYYPPASTKTYICEFLLGREVIQQYFGSAMHVFLPSLPRLEFAAFIPKGEYVTLCLLGHDIDKPLVRAFLALPEVRDCLPPGWEPPADFCHCSPKISIGAARHPYADRLIFVGDCGATRLYKDGIGSAYRTAKAAAITAVFEGISAQDFERRFLPICDSIVRDNRIGRLVFAVTRVIQNNRRLRRGLWRMVSAEQKAATGTRRMSVVLWDTFTGSAPYREVLLRSLHPAFLARLLYDVLRPGRHTAGPRRAA